MSLSIKEQIICLLKENHSDWNDSIDISDYQIIIPMLESFYQYDLISEYTKLFEADDDKMDMEQKLNAAGLKMAKQKANKNQHQLNSDKIKAIDKSLEKLQQKENELRSDIKSREALIKGKSAEEQSDDFEAIIDLRSELQDVVKSVQAKQKEKADLSQDIEDVEFTNDNKPEYKRSENGKQRAKLSDQEIAELESTVATLSSQEEKVDEQQERLFAFLNANPITQEIGARAKRIEVLINNLKSYVHRYSEAQSIVSSAHSPGGPLAAKPHEAEQAKKLVVSMPELISSTREEIASLQKAQAKAMSTADPRTKSAIESLHKMSALKTNISNRLESAKLKLDLDKKGEVVTSEPVKVVGKDPLAKETSLVQFRKKLSALTQNIMSMYQDALSSVESGNSSYPTVGAELSHRVRAFYGDQPESKDSRVGAQFANNARIGIGRDLGNQLDAFIANELISQSTDRQSRVLYDIAKKYKFSNNSLSSTKAFLSDVKSLYSMLSEIQHAASPSGQNLKIGREFVDYISQTLDNLKTLGTVSKTIGNALADVEFTPAEKDIDQVTDQASTLNFNKESLISILKLINTLGGIPEIAKYPQLVSHIKSKIATLSQERSTKKVEEQAIELITQITDALPAVKTDEKITSIQSLLSAIKTNRRITAFVNTLEKSGNDYVLDNNLKIGGASLSRIINKHRNGKGTYEQFYRDVLDQSRKLAQSDIEAGAAPEKAPAAAPEVTKARKVRDYGEVPKEKNWGKLSLKR